MAIKYSTSKFVIDSKPDFITDIEFIEKEVKPDGTIVEDITYPTEYKIDDMVVWRKPEAVTHVKLKVEPGPGPTPVTPSLTMAAAPVSTSAGSYSSSYDYNDFSGGISINGAINPGYIDPRYAQWLATHDESPTGVLHCYDGVNNASFNIVNCTVYEAANGSCNALDMGHVNTNSLEQWNSFPHSMFTQRNYTEVGSPYDLSPRYVCDGDIIGPNAAYTPTEDDSIKWHIANTAPRCTFSAHGWSTQKLGFVTQWPSMPYTFIRAVFSIDQYDMLYADIYFDNFRYHSVRVEWTYLYPNSTGGYTMSEKHRVMCYAAVGSTYRATLLEHHAVGPSTRRNSVLFGYIKLTAINTKTGKDSGSCTFWTHNSMIPSFSGSDYYGAFQNYRGLSDTTSTAATQQLILTSNNNTLYLGNNSNADETGMDS